jgi:NAD(P)-dependent dehydrogenase (short-subunit alcohol dehydrogenase family)
VLQATCEHRLEQLDEERLVARPGIDPPRQLRERQRALGERLEDQAGGRPGLDQRVDDRAGRIDAVVNNAGVAGGNAVEETSVEELAAVFETNVYGPLRVAQAVLPAMRAQGGGHVVNVTSVAAFVAPPFMGAYAASKHAADALGEALAAEVAPFGISVTNVAPGAYLTEMIGEVHDALARIDDGSPYADRLRTMLTRHVAAMEQQANPEEVATAVADAIHPDPPPARVLVPASSHGVVAARGPTPPEQLRNLLAASYGV